MKNRIIGTLKDSRNWFALAGILVGIIMVIMGFAAKGMFDRYGGDYRALAFGADFYTEIHEVTAHIATCLHELYYMIRFLISWGLILGGVIDICAFGSKLIVAEKQPAADADALPDLPDSMPETGSIYQQQPEQKDQSLVK